MIGLKRKNKIFRRNSFTIVEVVMTAAILAVSIVGIVQLFAHNAFLTDLSRNLSVVIIEAQDKMEEIRNHSYSSIVADYSSGGSPGHTFALTNPIGRGLIYIDSSNSNLLKIEIMVSWRNRQGRVIGEDADLDGVIDSGEDVNSNGKLDSSVTLTTYLARR